MLQINHLLFGLLPFRFQSVIKYRTLNMIFHQRNIILPYKYNIQTMSIDTKIRLILNDHRIKHQWSNEYKQYPRSIDHEYLMMDYQKVCSNF